MTMAIMLFGFANAPMAQQLEEIVVTAQKREQNLQDVPISVAVLDGTALEAGKLFSWDDIEVPGTHFSTGHLNYSLFVRGLGSATQDPGSEQAVQVFLDGVSVGRGALIYMGLMDVQRIEILHGPQPTFFGKNAIAGAVSYISRRPTDEFSGYVDLAYEAEAREFLVGAAVSGAIADNLNGRFAVRGRNMDGYIDNSMDGQADRGADDLMMRASLDWQPSDAVSVYAKFESGSTEVLGGSSHPTFCNPAWPPNAGEDCNVDYTKASVINPDLFVLPNLQGFFIPDEAPLEDEWRDMSVTGAMTDLVWDIGENVSLESTTSYYEYDFQYFSTGEFVQPFLLVRQEEDFSQFSQEIRFVSTQDSRVRWLAGAYYDTADLGSDMRVMVFGPMIGFHAVADQRADSWSAFAEIDFDLSETVSARLGGRQTQIDKHLVKSDGLLVGMPNAIAPGPTLRFDEGASESAFTPAVTLEWRPNDASLFFASYKEGFKAGGFDLLFGLKAEVRYEPEEAESMEIGAKFTLPNARINITVFSADYSNLQVGSIIPDTGALRVVNAAEASSGGVDFELALAASEAWTISSAVSLLDAVFDSYTAAQCYSGQINQRPTDCMIVPNPAGGAPGFRYDRSGQPLPWAMDWSGNLIADYSIPLQASWFGDPISFQFNAAVAHTDDQNVTADGDPGDVWPAVTKVHARIGVSAQDDSWQLALIGRNLTNEISALFNGDLGGPNRTTQTLVRSTMFARGRQVALNFRYNF